MPRTARSAGSGSSSAQEMAASASDAVAESELVRSLKQIVELRSGKLGRAAEDSVTLFGKKLCTAPKTEDQGSDACNNDAAASFGDNKMQSFEKLPPEAIVHLKELYKQHLKRRGAPSSMKEMRVNSENASVQSTGVLTLPLLNAMQENQSKDGNSSMNKDGADMKRQRVGRDHFFPRNVSLSISKTESNPANPQGPIAQAIEILNADKRRSEMTNVPKPAQLTFFYNGTVYVYEDVPVDKAKAIMILAGSVSSNSSHSASSMRSETPNVNPEAPVRHPVSVADLPQARKASLQRFLEKRKDRLYAKIVQPEGAKHSSRSPSPKSSRKQAVSPPRTPCRKACGEVESCAQGQHMEMTAALQIL